MAVNDPAHGLIRITSLGKTPWLAGALLALSIVLGAVYTWVAVRNFSMNPDGIAYIETGEAFLRGDWQTAANGYWSPVYAIVLALGLRLLQASSQNEFALVQLVNFVIYLFALGNFTWFWRQFPQRLPRWFWTLLGYGLFVWAALALIGIWSVTPDMLLSAWLFLAGGLIVRIREGQAGRGAYIWLGIVLGLAYLTKAVLFPLAFVFILASMLSPQSLRKCVSGGLIALVIFGLVTAPYIGILSQVKGRLTFGESGKLNYVRFVNGLPDTHWQGDERSGIPVHPTRQVFNQPAIYEFATPLRVTYAPWYDPSYWYEGVELQFNLRNQVGVLFSNILFLAKLFFQQQGVLIVGAGLLYCLSGRRRLLLREVSLGMVALAAFGLYVLVYIENRYLGAFIILFWGDMFAAMRFPEQVGTTRGVIGVAICLSLLANIGLFNLEGLSALGLSANVRNVAAVTTAPESPLEVAEFLRTIGIEPGAKVGVIGYAIESFWARTARVQIVAEMYNWESADFWLGGDTLQEQVLNTFKAAGAEAIVAENIEDYFVPEGWHQINQTNYYVKLLQS